MQFGTACELLYTASKVGGTCAYPELGLMEAGELIELVFHRVIKSCWPAAVFMYARYAVDHQSTCAWLAPYCVSKTSLKLYLHAP